jgi:Dimerisation domain
VGGQISELKTLSVAEEADALTPDAIMQLGTAFWGSKTLLSAVELKLFGALSEAGPLDAEELRERLGLHPRSARDFFDRPGCARDARTDERQVLKHQTHSGC